MAVRRNPIRARSILIAAVALTAFSSVMSFQLTPPGRRTPYLDNLLLNAFYWFTWAAVAPLIVWLAVRFRFERQGWPRALAVHVPAVVVFAELHIIEQEWFRRTMAGYAGRTIDVPFWTGVQRAMIQYFDWEMMTYWAIVGLTLATIYYREAQERALAAARLETKLVESQLQTLQSQLHPHFLFNTLHAISTLMHRDVEAADRMLSRLGELLRMTLDNVGHQEVTLKEELDFLEKYLQIEQTRFRDRLTVRFEVQPETLDGLVPWMLLQPLVENAIKHGIAPQAGPGTIRIAARREPHHLLVEVEDDGVGLSQEAVSALQSGIGLSTTRARLQYQFGRDYRFEFRRRPRGLLVTVAVPWREGVARGSDLAQALFARPDPDKRTA
jgi:signal transduction histidine kinase